MPLPAPLLRGNSSLSKKDFGSILIIAGSSSMLGAAALSSLAALRSGAGLVTAAVPGSLNLTLQKKVSNCVMTLPLADAQRGIYSLKAYRPLERVWDKFSAVAIGPGLGRDKGTQAFARQVIAHCPRPLVVDADALFALTGRTSLLLKAKAPRILTPHAGEMSRLTASPVKDIEHHRLKIARDFARSHQCVLLLKGQHTVVCSYDGRKYINRTGNVGMATAGSGDVLTGMITAFLGQGMAPFEAAKWGAYFHGQAGDLAARSRSKLSMIASDIIDFIPKAIV